MKPDKKRELTCIICPIGCRITVDAADGDFVFSGNKCPKGAEFARKEITAPLRTLTTTVRTTFPGIPVLPVKTSGEAPKDKLNEIIRELSKLVIKERIGIGETIVADILGTGIDIIATSDMLKEENP